MVICLNFSSFTLAFLSSSISFLIGRDDSVVNFTLLLFCYWSVLSLFLYLKYFHFLFSPQSWAWAIHMTVMMNMRNSSEEWIHPGINTTSNSFLTDKATLSPLPLSFFKCEKIYRLCDLHHFVHGPFVRVVIDNEACKNATVIRVLALILCFLGTL